jgi:DnaJ-class molecular chaperone
MAKVKQISLSESIDKNSPQMVSCPMCEGKTKVCDTCFGLGKISQKKKARINNA